VAAAAARRDSDRALHRRALDARDGVARDRARPGLEITTQADPADARPTDLVERQFVATRPNQLWVADFMYVATWRGFVYVAFVIDVFARAHRRLARLGIAAHRLRRRRARASHLRSREAGVSDLVHHSDRGTQYLSMRYTERLAEAGIAPSVGSRGDSYHNALAESIIGLFKTEVIQLKGPCRYLEAVEFATLRWVDFFNNRRLLEPIGYVPPAEHEANYSAQLRRRVTTDDGIPTGILPACTDQ
jgi:transposase InsO family protein